MRFCQAQILKKFADKTCNGSARIYYLTYSVVCAFDRTKTFTSILVLSNGNGIGHRNHKYKGEERSFHHSKVQMRMNWCITKFEQKGIVTVNCHSI